ncbi:Pectate lyase/Amb allergen [Clostridium sp. DL-VIII]|uniref:pectate lyase family protein n=1 Tax=Clostridium sp. DL-VIII TaxID=641107 RepID=UPI00023B07DA|nr:right-handed parallel beta-helix repeat-containing protein [Clostridium sp. DL-VIII]EHJ01642.1 Pectate lyase/Amb allergen [Clostridium sp. DL-VIII]
MKKRITKSMKVQKVSEKVMLAALASSMVIAPAFGVSASTISTGNTVTSTSSTTQAAVSLVSAKATTSLVESSTVSILDSEGWLESANVEWSPVSGATGYDVYYKGASASDSSYKQIDNDLIRKYPSYFRADVLGLAAGNYVIKIVPVANNAEVTSEQTITKTLSVKANTREGFAFSSASPMGTGSGGYNNDGTIASNAQVLYVTSDNVNTITADVITNSKGTKTTCTGLVDILAKRQKGYDKTPLIIRMIGEVKASDINGLNSSGYLQLKGCYNVTLEGVGEDATVYGWGILVRDAHNVEVRNLGIMLFPDDGISLDTDNENIWIHNNDIFYGAAGSDADQVKGDGSCDIKLSDYITVSYNHFHDSGKSSLCGMSDTEDFHVTYHHNWFDHSDSRHPRIRVGTVHVYNNYFDGNAKYGVGVTKGSSAFVEANYFRDCKYPMLTSLQGTDIYNNSKGTFSGEEGGMIKAYNNKIEEASRLVYANQDSTQFDAYLAASRNEVVPSTYKTLSGAHTYNNFDTSSSMYKYTPDSPENVESVVTTYAGRINGGDFIWNFTDADDADDSLNTQLMAKIKGYQSDLVSVGGNSVN